MDSLADLKLFNQLFATYQERFVHFATTYVRNSAVAEDITTESFLYWWENRASIDPGANLPAYLLTIVKNKCLNYLQHLQVREEYADAVRQQAEWALQTRIMTLEECNPNELFSAEALRLVREALAQMPEQSRRIFRMSRFEYKSNKEIAAELGMTVKGVEFHISKVLKALRKELKDYLPLFLF